MQQSTDEDGVPVKILIGTYHFYPDAAVGARRMTELARRLVLDGYSVTVLAAGEEGVTEEVLRGSDGEATVTVHRVPVPAKLYLALRQRWRSPHQAEGGTQKAAQPTPAATTAPAPGRSGRERLRHRLKRWYASLEWLVDDRKLWSARATMRALRLQWRQDYDVIISSGPPMSIHVGMAALRRLFRLGWIMDMRDPWVDNRVWPAFVQSPLRSALERKLEAYCCRRADWVTASAPGCIRGLRERYPARTDHLKLVLNGYDGPAPERLPLPPTGVLRMLYAGSLYYHRDPFPFLQALSEWIRSGGVDASRVEVQLVGQCSRYRGVEIAAWCREHGLGGIVSVIEPVPRERLEGMMRDANVLINFAQNQPDQIPAKVYDYLATGREMLVVAEAEGDTAVLAREAGLARVVAPGDRQQMVAALSELYAFYVQSEGVFEAPLAAIRRYSRDAQHQRFRALIDTTL